MTRKTLLLLASIIFLLSSLQFSPAQRKRSVRKTPKVVGQVSGKTVSKPEIEVSKLNEHQKLRLESFRVVWQTINDFYYDDKFNGLDWQKLKYENELKVVAAENDQQFYKILNDLIARLNSSHFQIIPPEFLIELDRIMETAGNHPEEESSEDDEDFDEEGLGKDEIDSLLQSIEEYNSRYGIGASLEMLGDELFITYLEKNSSAEKSGLRLGYKIEKVNGVDLAELIERFKKMENYETHLKKEIPLYVKTFLFNGEKDTTVLISFNDGKSPSQTVEVPRQKLEGELISLAEHLPRQFLEFETRDINEEIGYIRFNLFTVGSAEKFCQAVTAFKNKKSLIIDLRGNRGGVVGAVYGIGGLLVDQTILAGTAETRRSREFMLIRPHLKKFHGRIAVLTNGSSLSSAEIFASALKEAGRATIVGEKTAGQALASLSKVLPNGAVFQYPISNFKSSKGAVIEGQGVTPDITVALDKNSLINGIDNQLEEAVKFLQKPVEKPDVLAEITVTANSGGKAAPPPPPPPPPPARGPAKSDENKPESVYDEKAVEVIENYVKVVGGAEALRNLRSVSGYGSAAISHSGATIAGEAGVLRKQPNKYSENYNFTGLGEVYEIFDGEKFFVQSQLTGVEEYKSPVKLAELKLENDFLELVNLKENYSFVKFLGTFDRLGEEVHLVEVKTKNGFGFVLAFDVKTGFLVNRSGAATEVLYDDYRKVGDYFLPHKIVKGNTVTLEFDELQINADIEDASFEKKSSCFDKVD
jgi:carboxyl-terminal processing protease